MGNSKSGTTLGGQQSFFVKQNADGKYDLMITTYREDDNSYLLDNLKNINDAPVTISTTESSAYQLDNNNGEIQEHTPSIKECRVNLSALTSSDGHLTGIIEESDAEVTFAISQVVYIKYVAGSGDSPGYVVFGWVELESY